MEKMEVKELSLKGVKLIIPRVFHDERGFFLQMHHEKLYEGFGHFVQDNHSYSKQGVIRGMHYQSDPGQAKLIQVPMGKIYDVVVDIRVDSPTYGKWEGIYLDDVAHHQLFIPVGFAHGFQVVSQEAHVLYKVSTFYRPETEKTFRYDDPFIGIDWPMKNAILSQRDLEAHYFKSEAVT